MKSIKFDSEHVVTCSFDRKSKFYSLGVNSTPVLKVPEYFFDAKGFVWFSRAVVRLYDWSQRISLKGGYYENC